MEYRDLGVANATHGQFRAHVIRIKKDGPGAHDLHTTGLHAHKCDFQMFYVLKGWMRFVYEGQGEHTFREALAAQARGDRHNERECSDDVEVPRSTPGVHGR